LNVIVFGQHGFDNFMATFQHIFRLCWSFPICQFEFPDCRGCFQICIVYYILENKWFVIYFLN